MDKEDILKMSRESEEDEGMIYAENKGRRYGVVGFSVIFIVILFFNIFTKQNSYVPCSMYFAYVAAEAYGRCRITRQKSLRVATALGASSSILFLVCHIITVLGAGV